MVINELVLYIYICIVINDLDKRWKNILYKNYYLANNSHVDN